MTDYLSDLFGLKGKIAAVIGGGGFLCGEMAIALAKTGVKVAVIDQNMENINKVIDNITSNGGEASGFLLNVIDKENHTKCLTEILNKYNKVNILINGAGINAPTPLLDISIEEWNKIISVNLTGTLLGCQVFGKHMLDHKDGSIVNISSASAGPPLSKAFTYSVSKAGVRNLTQNLAREWATKGVRVNALRPGFFPTEWSKKHFIDKERENAILGHTPMQRYGRPDELVGAVLWLASNAASFVTGAEITVDGGFTAMTI